MAPSPIVNLLGRAVPALAKHLPKLWPLLLETKNRQRLIEAGRDVASQSPTRRLRGRIEVTATLADGMATDATTDEERTQAENWSRRSKNLAIRLAMPVAGRQAKAAHRNSIQEQLSTLQAEMNTHLGQ